MKSTIAVAVLMFAASSGAFAQDQKMLSDGAHVALQKIETIEGRGQVGTFVFRDVAKNTWEILTTLSCPEIRARTPLMAAYDIRLAGRQDLPAVTGVEWSVLETDIFSALSKFHDLCNASSNMEQKPSIVRLM